MAQSRNPNHLAVIEAVLRGENQSGFPDRAVILSHAREMQRQINALTEQLRTVQLELFNEGSHATDETKTG